MPLSKGQCKHFNGVQNEKCRAGVVYQRPLPCTEYIERSERGGTFLRAGEEPVALTPVASFAEAAPCPCREVPTEEEVQQSRREAEDMLAKTMAALKVAGEWRVKPKPATDRQGVVECPVCHGKLYLSQSAYNGHVHGQCETKDCVSWRE